jgi:hypothetical protein
MRIDGTPTMRRALRRGLLSLAVASLAVPASAQALKWDEVQSTKQLTSGTVLPPEGGSSFHRLRIDGSGQASTVAILTFERPSVKGPRYALTGQVRYEGIEGVGYLELWNYFPGGGQYFSRTLAESGPMMKLNGTSGWRTFTLPFDATGAPPPTRLVFNLVLQGKGVVYFGPLQLVDTPGGVDSRDSGGWTLEQTAGLLGGVGGSLVGGIGALIGVLTALGRARRFVDLAAKLLVILGMSAFVGGLLALSRSQPYAVYYPLLLLGFICAVLPLGLLPMIRKRYEDIEFRRMRAHDLS